jgi:hypothetical protein
MLCLVFLTGNRQRGDASTLLANALRDWREMWGKR